MSTTRFVRARRPEHKQQRRAAILAAARDLAATSGVRTVTLGGIAEAVGLAKSNVVRYFGTREEIYLALTADCWQDWATEVVGRLADGDDAATTLAETLSGRPLFSDLLSQMTTALEPNVTAPAAYEIKRAALDSLGEVAVALTARLPGLSEQECFQLAAGATAFAGLLYPGTHPPPSVAQVYAEHPELAFGCLPLLGTIKHLLAVLIAGLPAAPE